MLGLIYKNSGTIRVLGMDASKERTKMLKKIGYMPSETIFYPNMKVSEVIQMTAKAYKMDCRERARELCERLQVNTSKRIEELSLGNRKKVSIVCNMQHNPDLYIFDEPTSGLDPLMQKEFFSLLQEVNAQGAAIFFSSHVLSEIQMYCNKAAIIKEGKLITADTVENLSNTAAKKVSYRGVSEPLKIAGASNLQIEDGITTLLYQGGSKELLTALLQADAREVKIEEPSLEEIVLHFYGEER